MVETRAFEVLVIAAPAWLVRNTPPRMWVMDVIWAMFHAATDWETESAFIPVIPCTVRTPPCDPPGVPSPCMWSAAPAYPTTCTTDEIWRIVDWWNTLTASDVLAEHPAVQFTFRDVEVKVA